MMPFNKSLVLFVLIFLKFCLSTDCLAEETTNRALKHKVSSNLTDVNLSLLTDGNFLAEGAPWNSTGTIMTKISSADFILDLEKEISVLALVLQADWNDTYIISSSNDGMQWKDIWVASIADWGQGLRRRNVILTEPVKAHFLKIRAGSNDGVLSLSEFQVFSAVPANWDELTLKGLKNTAMQWVRFLTIPHVEYLRMMLAGLVLLLVFWKLGMESGGLQENPQATLLLLTVLAALGWCNFLQFHWGSLIHRHDVFHYYLGSKYSPELGYTRLYECSVVADKEDGFLMEAVGNRTIRNLDTNTIESVGRVLNRPQDCTSRFTPERWKGFKRDLSWFRQNMSSDEYLKVLKDHGYNATPVWNLTGYLVSNLLGATTIQLNIIGLLDPIIMSVAFLFCLSSFGSWPTALGVVYWGTSFIACFAWTGGAFLRLDWLCYAILGISFLKQKKLFPAGFFLVYAGMVRIFPFAFLAGLGVKLLIETIRRKNLETLIHYRKLFLGGIAAVVLAVATSTVFTGLENWKEFAHNTQKHFNTISTNMMGLAVVMGYSDETRTAVLQDDKMADPFEVWKTRKKELLQDRNWVLRLVQLLILVLMGLAIYREEDWGAAILGMGLIFMIRLSNYDYYFLLPLAFFWDKDRWSGVGLVFLAWISWGLPRLFDHMDEQYFWASVITLVYFLVILVRLAKPLEALSQLRASKA